MNRVRKRILICAAVVAGSVILTALMQNVQFFRLVDLKGQDAHFVLRGPRPTKNIVIVGIDDRARNHYSELLSFWQPYYADVMRAAAQGGAKVMVLDVAYDIDVSRYEKDNDAILAAAFAETFPRMPIICAFVASDSPQARAVPLNMISSAMGASAMANLTADSDDFVRKQVLIEEPKPGVPIEQLTRGMALRAAEKFIGQDATLRDGRLYFNGREVPMDADRNLTINYAGPADTFPHISLYDVVTAYRAGNVAQLEKWFKGKAVLVGPDVNLEDRHATPFYTAFTLSKTWRTAGVEVHANALNTLLTGDFLQPAPEWIHILALAFAATVGILVGLTFGVSQTLVWSIVALLVFLAGTHLLFLRGWLVSTTQTVLAYAWALFGGTVYRFATAEKKSSFLRGAVALSVGKQVASSLDQTEKISLEGQRRLVTILFTDIRGFTAFCESKDPAVVVELLNVYMSKMVSIIVKYNGHVNKFIGDGILAVFSDDDAGAQPGDHALRTVRAAGEMVSEVVGEFRTGAGIHSGEVVIGNVGSSDKLEFTVLGNTVNLASRLESLNKDQKTRLLMSDETREMLRGEIDTICLGAVPVRGKTEKMKLFTVTALLEPSRVSELMSVAQPA